MPASATPPRLIPASATMTPATGAADIHRPSCSLPRPASPMSVAAMAAAAAARSMPPPPAAVRSMFHPQGPAPPAAAHFSAAAAATTIVPRPCQASRRSLPSTVISTALRPPGPPCLLVEQVRTSRIQAPAPTAAAARPWPPLQAARLITRAPFQARTVTAVGIERRNEEGVPAWRRGEGAENVAQTLVRPA